MGDIHLNRAGNNLGIFSLAEVQSGLNDGRFLGTDLAWRRGMENWKPLSLWSDLVVPENVSLSAAIPALPSAGALAHVESQRLPSWEQRGTVGIFRAFGKTIKEVLFEPSATFSRMQETGGILEPFLFLLISSALVYAGYCVVFFGFHDSISGALAAQNPLISPMMAKQESGLGGVICNLITLPIQVILTAFLATAFWHVALMILGGAKKPFETTFRVYCYTCGSATLITLIPCLGWVVAPFWQIVSASIGLARVNQIGTGKALLAILLPLILCCGICGIGFYSLFHALSGNPEFINALKGLNNR